MQRAEGDGKDTRPLVQPIDAVEAAQGLLEPGGADGEEHRQRHEDDRQQAGKIQPLLSGNPKEGALLGEKYQLTNVSSSRMVIDERELYRRGVLAVMVDSLELEPGEATNVMVVLEGRDG
mgnify:CR=1 FL=1